MRIFIWIVVILVVLAGIGGGIAWKSGAIGGAANGTPVRIEKVTRGLLIETVSAQGQVEPRERVQISAKLSARIIELPFKEGQVVTKGNPNASPPIPASVLIKLDSSDLQAQLRATQARYAAQKSQFEVAQKRIAAADANLAASKVMLLDAERDLNRQKSLFETKDISRSAFDTAQVKYDQLINQYESTKRMLSADSSNLDVLTHEMEAAEAQIEQAQEQLSYTTITSPIDGTVTKVNAKVGELVVTGTMNNAGTVILEVGDLSQMIVKARVDESIIAKLAENQKAKIRMMAYPGQTFDGIVSTVGLALTTEEREATSYYKTEVLLKTDKRILSGLTADVDVETARYENVLKVPSQSVLGRPVDDLPPAVKDLPEVDHTKTFAAVVYRVIDGKAIVTPVSIGPSDITSTVIKSGLKEGEQVISGPYKILDALANDQKVVDEKTVAASTQPATKPAATPATQPATQPTTQPEKK